MSLRSWLARMRTARRARRLLEAAVAGDATARHGTSLKPRHAGRCVIQEIRQEDGEIVEVYFGIVRHPRPYAFSRQSHKVLEFYVLRVDENRIQRLRGENLTRQAGRDAD